MNWIPRVRQFLILNFETVERCCCCGCVAKELPRDQEVKGSIPAVLLENMPFEFVQCLWKTDKWWIEKKLLPASITHNFLGEKYLQYSRF